MRQTMTRTTTQTAPIAIKTAFPPSEHQQAVLNWVKTGKGSAIVVAVAGAGKTSTIMLIVPEIPENQQILLIAFGKEIAMELTRRLDELRLVTGRKFANVRVTTVHSLGFGALVKSPKLKGRKITVNPKNGGKLHDLANRFMTGEDYESYGDFACQLVHFAKGLGIGAIAPDSEDAWFKIIYHHDIMLDGEGNERRGIELARQLLQWSNEQAEREGVIDFDDQLYLPLLWKCRFWQNDFVLPDEAQDTNPVRRAIFRLCLKPYTGRLIAFGDPRQAIFGFTGASHDSLDLIKQDFKAIELPLTVSFRCSKAVVAAAQQIVPYIRASETAIDGMVGTLREKDIPTTLTKNDAILCRNTAPLVSKAYELIGQGTACRILGREIGTGLVKLIRNQKATSLLDLDVKLSDFEDREVAKYVARNEDQKAEQVRDRVACIRAVAANMPSHAQVSDLCDKLLSMFDDKATGVLTLSTIHKAKGKEYRQVAILQPELMPSKWARQEHQLREEENLRYVGYTRAQENLYMIAA